VSNSDNVNEVLALASQWCDERLDESGVRRLEELLRSDPEATDCFVEYVELHGQLHWEAGGIPTLPSQPVTPARVSQPVQLTGARNVSRTSPRKPLAVIAALATVAALLLIAFVWRPENGQGLPTIADSGQDGSSETVPERSGDFAPDNGAEELPPLRLENLDPKRDDRAIASSDNANAVDPETPRPSRQDMTDAAIVARIDNLLRESWNENEVTPVSVASDDEWIRRASLAFTGRIPTLEQVSQFVADKSPRKRNVMLQQLLTDDRLSESFAVIWTNLLVGRSTSRDIDADALFTFLDEQFRENRP